MGAGLGSIWVVSYQDSVETDRPELMRGTEDVQFDVKIGQFARSVLLTSDRAGQHNQPDVRVG